MNELQKQMLAKLRRLYAEGIAREAQRQYETDPEFRADVDKGTDEILARIAAQEKSSSFPLAMKSPDGAQRTDVATSRIRGLRFSNLARNTSGVAGAYASARLNSAKQRCRLLEFEQDGRVYWLEEIGTNGESAIVLGGLAPEQVPKCLVLESDSFNINVADGVATVEIRAVDVMEYAVLWNEGPERCAPPRIEF